MSRSRPPSMTSSAAGHGKPATEMQDHDIDILEEFEEVESIYSWPPEAKAIDWRHEEAFRLMDQ